MNLSYLWLDTVLSVSSEKNYHLNLKQNWGHQDQISCCGGDCSRQESKEHLFLSQQFYLFKFQTQLKSFWMLRKFRVSFPWFWGVGEKNAKNSPTMSSCRSFLKWSKMTKYFKQSGQHTLPEVFKVSVTSNFSWYCQKIGVHISKLEKYHFVRSDRNAYGHSSGFYRFTMQTLNIPSPSNDKSN